MFRLKVFEHWRRRNQSCPQKCAKINSSKKDPDGLDKESIEIGGDIFVLAAGIESGKIGRKVSVNLLMYPLKGRVTYP